MSRAGPIVTPRRILPHRSSSTESDILGRSRSTSSNRRDSLPPVVVSTPVRKFPRIQDRSFSTPTRRPVESGFEVMDGEEDSEALEDLVFTVEVDSDSNVIEEVLDENSLEVEERVQLSVSSVPITKRVASSGTLKLRKSSVKTLKEDNMNETVNFEGKIKLVDGKFKCNWCKFECLEIEAIYARKHARMLKCPLTKKKCKTSTKVYSCEECDYTCIGKSSLNQHKRTKHPSKKHRCSICHKEYSSRKCYRQHIKDHLLKFPCAHCPTKFPRRLHLVNHVSSVHTTDKSSSDGSNSNAGWKKQVKAALESGDVNRIEDTFKLCIKTCNTSSNLWISYVEWRKSQLTDRNKEEVDCLKKLVEEALEEDLDSRVKLSMFAAKLAEECGDFNEATGILANLRKKVECNASANEISEVLIETGKLEAKSNNYKTAYGLMETVVKMKFKSSQYKGKKYICPLCNQELSSKYNIDRHVVLVHSEVECDKCGEKFQGRKTLSNHSKSCPYMCKIVDCSFKSVHKWRFHRHMRQTHKT